MKRSEMVKILRDSFIYHMNPTGPAETDEEMYSNILMDLENAGMHPPVVTYDNYRIMEWEKE